MRVLTSALCIVATMALGSRAWALAAPRYVPVPAVSKPLFLPVADTFHEFDNYDLTGLDLRHFKDTTQTACSSACDVESQCKAYSFDKWNRMCFLKGTVKIFRLEPNTVSGLRPGSIATPVIASEAITIQRYRNKAFPWKGQQTAGASSYDECEERCKQDPACVALTFFKNTKQCRIMQSTDEYFSDPKADSAVKRQDVSLLPDTSTEPRPAQIPSTRQFAAPTDLFVRPGPEVDSGITMQRGEGRPDCPGLAWCPQLPGAR